MPDVGLWECHCVGNEKGACRRLFPSCRQTLPYSIMEGRPGNRPELEQLDLINNILRNRSRDWNPILQHADNVAPGRPSMSLFEDRAKSVCDQWELKLTDHNCCWIPLPCGRLLTRPRWVRKCNGDFTSTIEGETLGLDCVSQFPTGQ